MPALYIRSWEVFRSCDRSTEAMYLKKRRRHSYYKLLLPATHPVMKHAALPAIMALRTMEAKSDFRLGAKAPNPPSKIPMEPKLENPHRAYVATTSDLVFGKKKPRWEYVYYTMKIDYIEFLWTIGFILLYQLFVITV